MNPSTDEVNRTPTETAPGSLLSETCGVAPLGKSVHGQLSVPEVVKWDVKEPFIGVPPALSALETVTV